MPLSLPIDADANELLSASPLALLIGMLLDQQVTIEKAFTSPRDLVRRLGHEPTVAELAAFDPAALAAIFSARPALHRYPRAMAGRVQQLCQVIVDRYGGDAAGVWAGAKTGGAGGRRPGTSASGAGTTRWRTSSTAPRWPPSAPTSRT